MSVVVRRIRSNLVVNRIYTRAALSRREAEVLRLLGDRKTTPEIAAKLKVSLKTVQQYCARLKQNWTQRTSVDSCESRFCGVRVLLKSS
jgi:DNA-binding CsgD family transcriptional regulator